MQGSAQLEFSYARETLSGRSQACEAYPHFLRLKHRGEIALEKGSVLSHVLDVLCSHSQHLTFWAR